MANQCTGVKQIRVMSPPRFALAGVKAKLNQMADRSLIFLLDRSGSMETCRDDTIGGFNSFVKDQAALGGKLTLIQFDHEILISYSDVDLKNIKPLTTETFEPRGSTALLDAIGTTIKSEKSSNPLVIILTDGQENASCKYTKAHIKDLIEQKTKDGWTFMYLGANQDAFAEAGSLGIAPGCAVNYDVSKTPEAFRALSQTVSQRATQ
jgi:Mg-chelatase subunit ChlD